VANLAIAASLVAISTLNAVILLNAVYSAGLTIREW